MKSSKFKVKIVVGYREDQYHTIDANEAHKAYYLFLNPEARTVFSNGVALIGKDIMGVEPDFHATMGWNAGHRLNSDDYAQINSEGMDRKIRNILAAAKNFIVNNEMTKALLETPFSELAEKNKLAPPVTEAAKELSDKFNVNK